MQHNLSPEEVLADSLYGSSENCQKAAELGVQIIAPTMGSIKKEDHFCLSDFESSENDVVLACPEGRAPVQTKTNKAGTRHTAIFDSQHCMVCPFQETCPVMQGKKNPYLHYNNKNRGIAFFQQDGAVPSNDNHVYHNTIVMPSTGYYGIGLNYGAKRNYFFNNIIYTEGTVPCFSSTSTSRDLEISSDYNLLSSGGAIGEAGGILFSFQQWQGLGYGAHSLEASATETFVNYPYGDFMLETGSSAVDVGTATYSWSTDLLGNERPVGSAPDMGPYEFTGQCLNIDSNLNLSVPCAQYLGQGYEFKLNFYTNLEDSSGVYWEMASGSFHETFVSDCINIGNNLSLSIPCATFSGKQYAFVLDYYPNSVFGYFLENGFEYAQGSE